MRSYFVILIFLLISGVCQGNEYWNIIDADFSISSDWKFEFREEFRVDEKLYHYSSDIGLDRNLFDWLGAGVHFRDICKKNSKGEWVGENRPYLDLELKGKINGLEVSSRSRFGYQDKEVGEDLWRYRNRFKVALPGEYTGLKLQPYIAEEVFVNLSEGCFNRNRFLAGFRSNLSKNLKVDIFYLRQSSKSSRDWEDINIIGTSLLFHF